MARVTRGNVAVPVQPTRDFTPTLTDTAYKHSIVSSSRQPISALLTHIEGTSLTVDYYSQVLGRDEEVSTYDPNTDAVHQQYLQIKKLELKLQSELSTSVDAEDQTMNITGTAMMYPYVKPNVGDVFIADVGDGQAGLFTITEVEKKSMFKQSAYEVNFVLADYLNQKVEDNLALKTVKVTEFVKDFMTYGQNPVIATMDKLKYDKLLDLRNDILSDWLTEFFSVEYKTILVPNGQEPTYDPFLTQLIVKLFDKEFHPLLAKIELPNIDDNNAQYYLSIWDVILNRESYMLRNCFKEYFLLDSKKLNRNVFLQTAYYSGLKSIVYPKKLDTYSDEYLNLAGLEGVTKLYKETTAYTPKHSIPTFEDSYYVFSENFYKNHRGDASKLEEMVSNYLDSESNDWNILMEMANERHEWTRLQRFYCIPIILLLIIVEIRSI